MTAHLPVNTFNRTYRAPKFFLCTHTTSGPAVGFEPAEERFTHFIFLCRGGGRLHALIDGKFETFESFEPKKLFDLRPGINYNIVGEVDAHSRNISFNSWKKDDKWEGRLLTDGTVTSSKNYSCLVCLEGSCIVNGKEIKELEYADLVKDKEYPITIGEDSYVALFELCNE